MMSKTMILMSILIAYISLTISILSLSVESKTTGFTVDLIHRDSPLSPSYDSSITPSQRLANAMQRSLTRLQRFHAKNGAKRQLPDSDIISGSGEYYMEYAIGTPPVRILGIADTGSDIVWNQCKPCINCFEQELPIFQPNTSSTYKRIPCKSRSCTSVSDTSCSHRGKNCLYSALYGDGSSSFGEVSTDTITFGSRRRKTHSFPNVKIGCGFKNSLLFGGGESGIVGLGGGKVSLVRQLGDAAQGKFSYCLLSLSDSSKTSKLKFGVKGVVSGTGVVSTPLVRKYPNTYYYLTLQGISVGKQRLEIDELSDSKAVQDGNLIIDSGTTLTMLPFGLYDKFLAALKRSINLNQVSDPSGFLDLCYSEPDEIRVPSVTVHFKGADVKLKSENVFIRLDENTVCLAFIGTDDLAIYGNIAQMNFLVGYDLRRGRVSFKSTDCGKA